MTFAFLFLIYDNFTNPQIIRKFTMHDNIYIHPKNPNKVDSFFKPYIIQNLINTKWGEFSIVEATLNLLEAAYLNSDNEWFILLSGDTYPIYTYNQFINIFNKIQENKSMFHFISKNKLYYKTSQWWILKRDDVNIILNNKQQINKMNNGAYDEYYFLSILKWNNLKYTYTNIETMYTKWFKFIIQKSPLYFNKLLVNDYTYIKENNILFMRKVTSTFVFIKYKTIKKLFVIYIGEKTNQNIKFNSLFDIIIITSININLIKEYIINKAIYIINIIHKFFYETILEICYSKFILNWDIVIFTTEIFNINNYNSISKIEKKLPYNNFIFINKNINNIKKFYYIEDNNKNLAFCIKHKQLLSVF